MSGPLEGLFVLDLSRVLAGPFCSMQMADMGATVIKIEEPRGGDDTRAFGPPFQGDQSTYFMSVNRNKQSLALDMKAPEARDILDALAMKADVLLENFRPGTAARLGMGYDRLAAMNPRLVYVSVSGYGQTGPEAQRPGYDLVLQGLGGITSLTGDPAGPPYKVGVSQADLVAGLYAFQGALLALYAREKSGRGQYVDVSLWDCQISLLTFLAQSFFATGKAPQRMGNRHASIAPYEMFEVADGHLNVAVGNDAMWKAFCKAVAKDEWIEDVRYATNRQRVANREGLLAELEPLFRTRTRDEWMALLDSIGVPAGPILTVDQALQHPHVVARDMVVQVEHPTLGELKMVGNALKLSDTPPSIRTAPPLLGQHSESVLKDVLGYTDDQVRDLEARDVIRTCVIRPRSDQPTPT